MFFYPGQNTQKIPNNIEEGGARGPAEKMICSLGWVLLNPDPVPQFSPKVCQQSDAKHYSFYSTYGQQGPWNTAVQKAAAIRWQADR